MTEYDLRTHHPFTSLLGVQAPSRTKCLPLDPNTCLFSVTTSHYRSRSTINMKRKNDQPPIILRLKRPSKDDDINMTAAPPTRLRQRRLKNQADIQTISPLLKLPPELRNVIWELLVDDAPEVPIDLRHFRRPAVTQACRQTRKGISSMVVPALQDKEWWIPLLVCLHRIDRLDRSYRVKTEHMTLCEDLGEDLIDWSVAPWLRDLAIRPHSALTTTNKARFYREVEGDEESDLSLLSHRRDIEDERLAQLNRYGTKTEGRMALDLDRVMSLAEAFHEAHYNQVSRLLRDPRWPAGYSLRRRAFYLPIWAENDHKKYRSIGPQTEPFD